MLGDIRSAVRSLCAKPAFTLFVVTVLALGTGANTAIFSVLNAVLLRPLAYPDSDRLYAVSGITARGAPTQVVPAAYNAIRQRTQTVERSTLTRMRPLTIEGAEGAELVYGEALAGDGLEVFGTPPALGRLFRPGSVNQVVLSHRLWVRRYHSDPEMIGRTLSLNGDPYTVVGIMPRGFETTNRVFEIWMPWRFTAEELAERSAGGFTMLVRRRASASEEQVRAELAALGQIFAGDLPPELRGWRTALTQLKDLRVGQYRRTLWVMLGAVGLVLLIACLNVACLMIARALDRRKEMVLRLALGAPRWLIVRQWVTESLALSTAGGLIGILFAWWGTRAIIALSPARPIVPRLDQAGMDGRVLLFSLAIALATGIVLGLAPAWHTSRIELQEALKQSSRTFAGGRSVRLGRDAAVTLQVALSLVLVAGAALLLLSFVNLLRTDPGFRPEGVLTVRVPAGTGEQNEVKLASGYRALLERVRALAGVEAAALSTVLPLGPVEATTTVAPEGGQMRLARLEYVQYRAVSPDYFHAMGIPLLRGRTFNKAETANAAAVAIVNDVLARKYWLGEDPIGKLLTTSLRPGEGRRLMVVGVVGAVRQSSLKSEPAEELYRPYMQHLFGAHGATLVLRAGRDPRFLVEPLRRLLREEFPNQPVAEIRTMVEWVEQSVAGSRFNTTLFAVFAFLALTVATIGIYGVISYNVRRRWKEIGVRIALGATPRDISALVMRQAIRLVAPGLIAGIAGTLLLSRFLAAQLYEIKANDPAALAGAAALLCATGLLAAWAPARRARRANPAETLRQE